MIFNRLECPKHIGKINLFLKRAKALTVIHSKGFGNKGMITLIFLLNGKQETQSSLFGTWTPGFEIQSVYHFNWIDNHAFPPRDLMPAFPATFFSHNNRKLLLFFRFVFLTAAKSGFDTIKRPSKKNCPTKNQH